MVLVLRSSFSNCVQWSSWLKGCQLLFVNFFSLKRFVVPRWDYFATPELPLKINKMEISYSIFCEIKVVNYRFLTSKNVFRKNNNKTTDILYNTCFLKMQNGIFSLRKLALNLGENCQDYEFMVDPKRLGWRKKEKSRRHRRS